MASLRKTVREEISQHLAPHGRAVPADLLLRRQYCLFGFPHGWQILCSCLLSLLLIDNAALHFIGALSAQSIPVFLS